MSEKVNFILFIKVCVDDSCLMKFILQINFYAKEKPCKMCRFICSRDGMKFELFSK